MHPTAVAQVLVLVVFANSAPVAATKILGKRFAWSLDFGLELCDGQPLFGTSKTIRGVALGILSGLAGAPLVGLEIAQGAQIASLSMVGDLLSSFIKRRLHLPPSSQAVALDQIPESLFPLIVCTRLLGLSIGDVATGVLIFLVGELLASRLLFSLHLRDKPY